MSSRIRPLLLFIAMTVMSFLCLNRNTPHSRPASTADSPELRTHLPGESRYYPVTSDLYDPTRWTDDKSPQRVLSPTDISDRLEFENKINLCNSVENIDSAVWRSTAKTYAIVTPDVMSIAQPSLGAFDRPVQRIQSFGSCCGYTKRYGTRETRESIEKALAWLAYHQEIDGHWDSTKYGASEATSDICQTSLAIMAFLNSGHTFKVGMYRENVRRAVAWLQSQQRGTGGFSDAVPRTVGDLFPTVLAALALSEAAWYGRSNDLNFAAYLATDYCVEKIERGTIGWHSIRNESDFAVAGWYVQMLKAAKAGWVEIDYSVRDHVLQFCNETAVTGEFGPDAPARQYGIRATPQGPIYSGRTWAIGIFARQYLSKWNPDLSADLEVLSKEYGVPSLSSDGKDIDLEYCYFSSYAAFAQQGKIWQNWNAGLQKLPTIQNKVQDDCGSWTGLNSSKQTRGRVGHTALAALCLEVYYPAARFVDRR